MQEDDEICYHSNLVETTADARQYAFFFRQVRVDVTDLYNPHVALKDFEYLVFLDSDSCMFPRVILLHRA